MWLKQITEMIVMCNVDELCVSRKENVIGKSN